MAEEQPLEKSCYDTNKMPEAVPRPLESSDGIPIEVRKNSDKEPEDNDGGNDSPNHTGG